MSRRAGRRVRATTRRELWVVFVFTALIASAFLLLTAAVWRTNATVGVDRALTRIGAGPGTGNVLADHPGITHLAESLGTPRGVAIGTALVVLVALVLRDLPVATVAVLAPVGSFVAVEYIAKPLVNQPIPYGGRSFPSGHAAGVAALAAVALLLIYRHWGGVAAVIAGPVAVGAVALVGLGVLRLDFHHYPTDVLGGAALGAVVALAVSCVFLLLFRPRTRVAGRRSQPSAVVESGATAA